MAKRQASPKPVNLPAALKKVARALEVAGKEALKVGAAFQTGRVKCYRDSKVTATRARKAKRR